MSTRHPEESAARPARAGSSRAEQPALVELAALTQPAPPVPPAPGSGDVDPDLPVARVAIEAPTAHLDRPFDYAVPREMAADARPGARVMVRFAGKDRSGYILDRAAASDHEGSLTPIRRVVSPVPVLTPETIDLCRAVAGHYAGRFMDVVRLAIPSRHARTERSVLESETADRTGVGSVVAPEIRIWREYQGGPAFVRRLAAGEAPRAVWNALPWGHPDDAHATADDDGPQVGDHWTAAVAEAAAATTASGRGVLIVVPTTGDIDAVVGAVRRRLPEEPVAQLTAEDGPSRRYRAFMRILTGRSRVVVGTRTAAFAPVAHLGLAVCWDDGDENHAERRSPYPHARQVLAIRAAQQGAGLLVGGWSRSVAAQALVASGWAHSVTPPRTLIRSRTPRVDVPSDEDLARFGAGAYGRIPAPAWKLVSDALLRGPVLVSVPRAGYVPVVVCGGCRERATCTHCHGPLGLPAPQAPGRCRWCGRDQRAWRCPHCHDTALRAARIGSGRTAEELGRAFPQVPVLTSSADSDHGVVETVDDRPRLVIATPAAEPRALGGYAGALVLDAASTTNLPVIEAGAEAVRRWMTVAAQVRPSAKQGRVMILGSPAPAPAQALVRWDPEGHAARELAERTELGLPPASTMAAITGAPRAVRGFLSQLPEHLDVLGPTAVEPPRRSAGGVDPRDPQPSGVPSRGRAPVADAGETVRALVRTGRDGRAALCETLSQLVRVRSARKEPAVRIQLDPASI